MKIDYPQVWVHKLGTFVVLSESECYAIGGDGSVAGWVPQPPLGELKDDLLVVHEPTRQKCLKAVEAYKDSLWPKVLGGEFEGDSVWVFFTENEGVYFGGGVLKLPEGSGQVASRTEAGYGVYGGPDRQKYIDAATAYKAELADPFPHFYKSSGGTNVWRVDSTKANDITGWNMYDQRPLYPCYANDKDMARLHTRITEAEANEIKAQWADPFPHYYQCGDVVYKVNSNAKNDATFIANYNRGVYEQAYLTTPDDFFKKAVGYTRITEAQAKELQAEWADPYPHVYRQGNGYYIMTSPTVGRFSCVGGCWVGVGALPSNAVRVTDKAEAAWVLDQEKNPPEHLKCMYENRPKPLPTPREVAEQAVGSPTDLGNNEFAVRLHTAGSSWNVLSAGFYSNAKSANTGRENIVTVLTDIIQQDRRRCSKAA